MNLRRMGNTGKTGDAGRNVSMGPGAASLILIFVVLGLTVLGMLGLMSAEDGFRLAARSCQVTESVCTLQAQAEETRAALDEILYRCAGTAGDTESFHCAIAESLPEAVSLENNMLTWTEYNGKSRLECALRVNTPGAGERSEWEKYELIMEIWETWN